MPSHTWSKVKDASNFVVPWHGIGPSSKAGDVILDVKVKLKSRESSEYARQKQIDETHLVVVEKFLNLAECAGRSRDESKVALKQLGDLTSPTDAGQALELIDHIKGAAETKAAPANYKTSTIVERKLKWKLLARKHTWHLKHTNLRSENITKHWRRLPAL